ncbi:MAG TPA: glycosyltransferase, partial [Bacteroidales bacterium]|nr:glycosyltransferase [Bacteroidales bacterium]
MSKISVVVTVYNEEDNILPLVEQITAALQGMDYEVIYVDDGSRDRTAEVIRTIPDPRIHLIVFKKN